MRSTLLGSLLLGWVAVAGCDRSAAREIEHSRIPHDVLARMKLGATTPADVERLFGTPDQRAEDGALVYESQRTRQSGKVDHETTTFRFESGVLSKVCQSRP